MEFNSTLKINKVDLDRAIKFGMRDMLDEVKSAVTELYEYTQRQKAIITRQENSINELQRINVKLHEMCNNKTKSTRKKCA